MRASTFFEGVHQMEVPLGDRSLKVPVFYYDGSAMTAVFPARLSALRRWMPDRRFVPARLAPGVGAVTITCFEYRETDIDPYNELAIAVPLNEPFSRPNLPGRAMLGAARRGQYDVWVHHLPVTTDLACRGGVEFYNYPKFVGSIEFEEQGSRRRCRLGEGDETILTLDGPLVATPGQGETQLFSHLWMDRQPQSSEFKLNVLAGGRALRPGSAWIELGASHPIARELDGLVISRRAIYYELLARFEGILYGPDHLSLPLIQRAAALIEPGLPAAR